jgi:class 3 adenylate cyclase
MIVPSEMSSQLPAGVVTLLFSDIEGSTRLLRDLGDAYDEALAVHRRIVRGAVAAHGGVEVDTQGDAFFVAFARLPTRSGRPRTPSGRWLAARSRSGWGSTRASRG